MTFFLLTPHASPFCAGSDALDDPGNPLPHSDAHGAEGITALRPPHLQLLTHYKYFGTTLPAICQSDSRPGGVSRSPPEIPVRAKKISLQRKAGSQTLFKRTGAPPQCVLLCGIKFRTNWCASQKTIVLIFHQIKLSKIHYLNLSLLF